MIRNGLFVLLLVAFAWPAHATPVQQFREHQDGGFAFTSGVSFEHRFIHGEGFHTSFKVNNRDKEHSSWRSGGNWSFLQGKHINCIGDGSKADPDPPVVPEAPTAWLLLAGMIGLIGTSYFRGSFSFRL